MSELQINTTQNVNISFTAASVGERILAYLIDAVIMIAYIYGAMQLLKFLGYKGLDDMWSEMAVMSLIFLPVMLYTFLSEFVMEGQTVGKRSMRIKVVKIDGYQASIFDYFTRWLFRLIDIYFAVGTGIIAIVSISVSERNQRLGGIASGTAVISIKNINTIKASVLEEVADNYQATFPSVINLSDNDMRIIKDMYENALKSRDSKIMQKLRIKIEDITKTSKENRSDTAYLRIIMNDYKHFTQNM